MTAPPPSEAETQTLVMAAPSPRPKRRIPDGVLFALIGLCTIGGCQHGCRMQQAEARAYRARGETYNPIVPVLGIIYGTCGLVAGGAVVGCVMLGRAIRHFRRPLSSFRESEE
ncbi:hypothetical protein Pan44_37340 [Caulifigura coniformis]|uniref:Uncharacterized protein n=1 Tax=Caulifigura coniformis TaxID=2527983 RepID=A0A517SHT8_9PLAN|nr:hypothetical protein [Caulifigura coniformis]QDT55688.1 hypothetical protein Pan44_37340 [Caulifigura coniformis]